MNNFITVAFRKSIFLRFILKIKQLFFFKRCKKQFKKDLKNDVNFTKLRENNPISNFDIRHFVDFQFGIKE